MRFNPEMVVLARESRALTQSALAREVGLSQSKLSKIENGELTASPEDTEKVARALNYPVHFFAQTDQILGAGISMFHRRRQSLSARDQRRLHALINIIRIQVSRLLRSVEVQSDRPFPSIDVDEHGSPEATAEFVRAIWQVAPGPIGNLVKAIENASGIVVRFPFGTRKLDAISYWPANSPPYFFVNTEFPNDRIRFSLAHELAHMIMHSGNVPAAEMEDEANRFASEFLMPARLVGADLRAPLTIRQLSRAKARWRVSMAALLHRASQLGTISQHQTRRRWMELGKLGYRLDEPVELPTEDPSVVRSLVEIHLDKLDYSIAELSRVVDSSESEFRARFLAQGPSLRVVH